MPCAPGREIWTSPEDNAMPLKTLEQEKNWWLINFSPVAACIQWQDAWEREGGGTPEAVTKLQAGIDKEPGWSNVKKEENSKCKNQIEKDRSERQVEGQL